MTRGLRLIRRPALRAGLAHQPLRDDERQRGGDQERLGAHVEQPGDGADRVVGVQGREHEVTGQRGLQRQPRGLAVPDLTDQDDVGVLAQDRAQTGGERQTGLFLTHRTWVMPASAISTGSSSVMTCLSRLRTASSVL